MLFYASLILLDPSPSYQSLARKTEGANGIKITCLTPHALCTTAHSLTWNEQTCAFLILIIGPSVRTGKHNL